MKKRRVEILNEVDALKEFLCEKCKATKGNGFNRIEGIMCNCESSKRMRELGEELLTLVEERHHDKLLKEICWRGYIRVPELLDLNLNYDVSQDQIIHLMEFKKREFNAMKQRLGLKGIAKMSSNQLASVCERYKHIRINQQFLEESLELKNASRRCQYERETSKSKAQAMV